jgi:flagellar hook-associated protein 1 FlgK
MPASDNPDGNFDLNNDGINEVSAIFKAAGNNRIDASAAIGIAGTLTFVVNNELESTVQIDYNVNDTALTVIKKINDARIGVVAYMNHDGNLAIKATTAVDNDAKNFMIRHLEDSGRFLVGFAGILKQSGPQGSFDYRRTDDIAKFLPGREHLTITPKFNPASYLSISDAIERDVDRISAARGKDIGGTGDYNTSNGIGDGGNALLIASLRHRNGMVDVNATFNDFYNAVISRVGAQGEEAQDRVRNQETLLKNLANLRESISGVNLDEEMSNMVAYQHGYNAAARVITAIDRMLDTIINRMGV